MLQGWPKVGWRCTAKGPWRGNLPCWLPFPLLQGRVARQGLWTKTHLPLGHLLVLSPSLEWDALAGKPAKIVCFCGLIWRFGVIWASNFSFCNCLGLNWPGISKRIPLNCGILQNYCIMERWVGCGRVFLLQHAAQSGKQASHCFPLAELEASKDRDSSLSGWLSQLCAALLVKEVPFCPVQTSQVVVCLTVG